MTKWSFAIVIDEGVTLDSTRYEPPKIIAKKIGLECRCSTPQRQRLKSLWHYMHSEKGGKKK